ncbi:hyccin isoform X2 [Sinocyclocheilus rhinocerous]|uniref:hyccin isoform X2 n=1 Tax=Sinocyclocheilus rhinocerous TaxID=307959 RepID=UPI0007B9E3AD|nr:PREDICTED: hyccin isoform X2 [Sinocyclocheilus rhinocerous]
MLAMDQGVVEEWLSEFKTLPDTAVSSYAASLKDKGSLVPALYKVIRENYSDEIVDKDGQSKVLSFTIPSLSKPSVYHEPSSIGSLALTEGALANHGLSRVVYSGPHLQRETFTAQNRFEVLTFLLLCYNASLSYMSSSSLQSLCQLSSRVSICGYPRQQVRRYKGISSRLMVTSEFLVQLITGIHFALCNGEVELGSRALDDVLYRAQLELFPEALLVGNAIKSSLHGASLKANKEGTRSIQVEITPTASRISRNAVTSLSIRGHRWKRHDAVDLGSPDELTEIVEVDEGICTQACAAPSSPPTIVISSSGGKPGGKGLRRLTGRSSKDKDAATGVEQLSRKQATVRAMSENLELLSLKRLTLTKSGSLSLSRTASAVFSRSFEQVSSVLASSPTANHVAEADDGGVAYLEHLSPAHQHRQRSPTISIHVTSDL